MDDDEPWATIRVEIENIFHTDDGAIIVQYIRSGTINGLWRGFETAGQELRYPMCCIFSFDESDRIIFEEAHYDMLSVTGQLGLIPNAGG